MLYLSKIINSWVFDPSDKKVAKVIDVIIQNSPDQKHPPIEGIVVVSKNDSIKQYIPVKSIQGFTKNYVTIKKILTDVVKKIPTNESLIGLKDTILDKQIVDLEGIRVVRVNDLQFGYIRDVMSVIALDIGQSGLVRRLGVPLQVGKKELLDWEDVRLIGNKIQLSTCIKDINKLHPADVANLIEKMNLNQGSMLLESMDERTAARVLEEIEPEIQKILVEKLGHERAVGVMQKMSVDELVDLIQLLPAHESKRFIEELPSDLKKQHVKKILEYDEDTAGGLMTTEYLSAYPGDTVEQVIDTIRRISHIHSSIYFVYIVDKKGKFRGVVSMRSLMLADPGKKVSSVMKKGKKIATTIVSDSLLQVAVLITKYNLFSVAVLDHKKRLLGVVTVDDIMRHFVPHA